MEKAIRKYSSNDKLFAFFTSFSRKPTTTTTSNNLIKSKLTYPNKTTTEAAADSAASDHYFPIGFDGGAHDTSGMSYPVGTADGGTMHSAATDLPRGCPHRSTAMQKVLRSFTSPSLGG